MSQVLGTTRAAGTLDPSFGEGGIVMPPARTRSIAVIPDNKVIVFTGDSLGEPITVARLTEAGELDPSFGIGGEVEVPVTGPYMLARQIIALENGKYLISGYEAGTASTKKYVCRLLEDGQPDTTFGEGGIATIRVPDIAVTEIGQDSRFINGHEEGVAANANFFSLDQIAVSERHAKIYLSALISSTEGFKGVVYRFNEDGSRDTSFNGGYVLISPEVGSGIRIMALTPHGDGVLIGGGFVTSTGLREVAFLKRFDQRGNIDISFGERGTVILPNGTEGRKSIITSVAMSDSGLIVTAGESGKGGEIEGLIAVLNPNGGFNLIFNRGQPLYAAFLQNLVFSTLVLQQNRKIVVTGSGDGGYLMAARYELDGSLDLTFGDNGWIVFNPIGNLTVLSCELTADNKIVVLGSRELRRYVVRYLG
jgi:uncharacterized delta-60 repeat protein